MTYLMSSDVVIPDVTLIAERFKLRQYLAYVLTRFLLGKLCAGV